MVFKDVPVGCELYCTNPQMTYAKLPDDPKDRDTPGRAYRNMVVTSWLPDESVNLVPITKERFVELTRQYRNFVEMISLTGRLDRVVDDCGLSHIRFNKMMDTLDDICREKDV